MKAARSPPLMAPKPLIISNPTIKKKSPLGEYLTLVFSKVHSKVKGQGPSWLSSAYVVAGGSAVLGPLRPFLPYTLLGSRDILGCCSPCEYLTLIYITIGCIFKNKLSPIKAARSPPLIAPKPLIISNPTIKSKSPLGEYLTLVFSKGHSKVKGQGPSWLNSAYVVPGKFGVRSPPSVSPLYSIR